MDFVSPVLDIGTRLWDCSSKHVACIYSLEENLQKLQTEKEALNRRRGHIQDRVEVAERNPRMRRTEEVEEWLTSAQTMDNEVTVILDQGYQELQNKCVGCCPKNIISTYKIAKRIIKKIDSVSALLLKAETFHVLSEPRPQLLVPKWYLERCVGLESTVERVWTSIEDENVRIIGLCGKGGVGKTTLLKKISNEFLERSHDFDVIWVAVPREEGYMGKVQEVIRKKLRISDVEWNECSDEDEKGALIFNVLNGKKFVLMLDNVWEQFDLEGRFLSRNDHQNQSKVIFTARSLSLFFDMEAQVTIEVQCLPPEQALSLFRMTVGESILNSDPDIPELANTLARRCGGLPLALLTVARAMACRKNLSEWRHTVQLLHKNPSEIARMGGYVFPLLKLSYDSLDAVAQKCFLYFSIFPEDYNIKIDEVIDLWIGEGFLDGTDPCDRGVFIVGTLKLACLLESDESNQCVRMHDILRHMALWLAREQGKNKNKVLAAKIGKITDQELVKWGEATWIFLFGGGGSNLKINYSPSCRYLSTLVLRDAQLESFPSGFFDSMPALKVLDLSGNQGLVDLPSGIRHVKNLQYLNLSSTSIARLPDSLGDLNKLRCLLLDYTKNLKWIPKEVIANLITLQVYSKIDGVTEYSSFAEVVPYDEFGLLEVLEGLNDIKKIGITIFTAPSLEKILKSNKLRNCIRKLTLVGCTGLVSLNFGEDLSNLERLELFHCGSVKEFKISGQCKLGNLRKVHIGVCPLLLNLDFLSYATKLESLTIFDCESMKTITWAKAFPQLKTISLSRLQNLKSICPSAPCFPSLLEIEVSDCPILKQLPFDLESAKFLQRIKGETEWWNGLIWDNEAVKNACRLKFESTLFQGYVSSRFSSPVQGRVSSPLHGRLSDSDQLALCCLESPYHQLNLEALEPVKDIQNGSDGMVQLVLHKRTGQFLAVKIIGRNIEESALKQIEKELKITQSYHCPYVVNYYRSFYDNGAISIILEYMDCGSLADFLKKVKSIPEPYLAAICKQVLKGLMYLHQEERIIHRDIKPSNLLINHRGEVKITDLEESVRLRSTSERANTFAGTYFYMSPERIVGDSYGITADIWSLGIVLLECATGKYPYSSPEQAEEGTNIFELMEQIVEQPPPSAPSEQFSPEFCSFISSCLQKEPEERKTAHELLAMPFLNMCDDSAVDLSSYFADAGRSLKTLGMCSLC